MQFMKSFFTGTDTDFLAGYRACKCLKGFYRTHMFEKCHKCLQGMACQDDHISLKSGYWWEWRNQTSKGRYQKFIKNLAAVLPALGIDYVQYPHPIPTPHQCPREEACKGGLDSPCADGYEGPLCAVCSLGYYRQPWENLQTMSFQEMDYRTVFHRCCPLSGNCGGHSVVNFQRKCQEGPGEIFDRQVPF